MNRRQRVHRLDRSKASPVLDRGSTGGWHLDLACPLCSRACRVLFSPGWARDLPPDCRLWACRHCLRVTYRSSNRPGSTNGRRPQSHAYRKHLEEAIRIRRDLMKLPPDEAAQLMAFPSRWWLTVKPRGVRIHWERWEALRTLASCHEALAEEARFSQSLLFAAARGLAAPAGLNLGLRKAYNRILWEQLEENSWATRQSSWHRQGRPRGGPGQRERSPLKTSRDDRRRGSLRRPIAKRAPLT